MANDVVYSNISVKLSREEYKDLVAAAQKEHRSAAQQVRALLDAGAPADRQVAAPSGKPVKSVVARVEDPWHDQLRKAAQHQNKTLSEYCRAIIVANVVAPAAPA